MLVVNGLTKSFKKKTNAVDNISFQVNSSEICVLLGPNGAGKSTTIKGIAGLLRIIGKVTISGHTNQSIEAKQVFGYVPETPALYDLLTVDEHFEFIAKAYGLKDYADYKETLIKRFDLEEHRDKVGKELSKGMQQKVSICCALLIRPKFIMFDEPMIGLDPKAINELKKTILELKEQGCALLISTHIIDSIDEIWDRVLIMNKGKVVSDLDRESIRSQDKTLEEIFFMVTDKESEAK